MNEPLVSIIIPIYKTEKYLDECIRSITQQSYGNLEILLLDDGSPDSCPEICDRWALQDPRIRVIHKQNSGVSATRNLGISLASGKYVTFTDSDDYLEKNAVEILVKYALQYESQCVAGGFKRLQRDGTLTDRPSTSSVVVCRDRKSIEQNVLDRLIGAEYREISPLSQSACVKLYERCILEKYEIKFLDITEIGSEDFYFNICFFEHAESAVIIPETFYVYRDNGESCSNNYQPKRLESFLKLYRKMETKQLYADNRRYLQMLSANILGGISVCIKLMIASNIDQKISVLSETLKKEEIRKMLKQCSIRKIRFPLSLFCILMRFRMRYTLYILIRLFLILT